MDNLELKVDMGVIPIKRYSSFPKAQEFVSDAQQQFHVKHTAQVLFDTEIGLSQVLTMQVIKQPLPSKLIFHSLEGFVLIQTDQTDHWVLIGTITSSHIKARNNANEEVLYIPNRSRIRAKRSATVSYQTQDSSCI